MTYPWNDETLTERDLGQGVPVTPLANSETAAEPTGGLSRSVCVCRLCHGDLDEDCYCCLCGVVTLP